MVLWPQRHVCTWQRQPPASPWIRTKFHKKSTSAKKNVSKPILNTSSITTANTDWGNCSWIALISDVRKCKGKLCIEHGNASETVKEIMRKNTKSWASKNQENMKDGVPSKNAAPEETLRRKGWRAHETYQTRQKVRKNQSKEKWNILRRNLSLYPERPPVALYT